MLVQRQVLATDDPNITPTELESATSQLFNTLAELLDNFPDVSTAKIMEVMLRSSSSSSSGSTTGSPSDERTESRKQILARVFLKSLQTDDPVFKKVSRSVYCAFRAITLGGARGRKLADAALRRIGATKLTGRVVRSAEILIRAATISQLVHGPWYNHLV